MSQQPLWSILSDIGRKGASGVLIVKTSGMEKRAYFKLGFLRQIDSNPPDPREMFGVLLRSQGKLSDEDIRRSLELMKEKHVFQGEALLLLGKLKLDEVDNLLTWQQNIKLFNLLAIKDFTCEFRELPPDKIPKGFNINLYGNIFLFLKKTLTVNDTKQYVDDNSQSYAIPVKPPPFNPDECFVRREDKKFYEIILNSSPPLRVNQLFERSPFPKSETYITIYSFVKMGFVTLQARIDTSEFDLKKFTELYKDFKEVMDYFQILGVHWSSCSEEINAALDKRKREFRLRDTDLPEIKNLKTKILERVDEAFNFLKDEKNRIEYRKKILDKFAVATGAQVLFEKGEISLELRQNVQEAYELFASAYDLATQNLDYAAAYGYIKYRRYKTTDIQEARKGEALVELAVAQNPRSYYTHYYKARLLEDKGMIPSAVQELKTAIAIAPTKMTAKDMLKRLTKSSG